MKRVCRRVSSLHPPTHPPTHSLSRPGHHRCNACGDHPLLPRTHPTDYPCSSLCQGRGHRQASHGRSVSAHPPTHPPTHPLNGPILALPSVKGAATGKLRMGGRSTHPPTHPPTHRVQHLVRTVSFSSVLLSHIQPPTHPLPRRQALHHRQRQLHRRPVLHRPHQERQPGG